MEYITTGVIGEELNDYNTKGIKCPWCETLLTNAQLHRGNKYCCRSCQVSMKNHMNWKDPEYREKMRTNESLRKARSENLSNLWKDQAYRDMRTRVLREQADRLAEDGLGIHSYESFANRAYARIVSSGKEVTYYLASFEDDRSNTFFKLGVTADLVTREWIRIHDAVKDLIPLYKGPAEDIALLEYDVKIKYSKKNWEASGVTEAFLLSEKDEILAFIDDYVKSSTTIEKVASEETPSE